VDRPFRLNPFAVERTSRSRPARSFETFLRSPYGLTRRLSLLLFSRCCSCPSPAVFAVQFTPLYFGTPGAFPRSDPPLGGGYTEPWALNSIPKTTCDDNGEHDCTCSTGVSGQTLQRAPKVCVTAHVPAAAPAAAVVCEQGGLAVSSASAWHTPHPLAAVPAKRRTSVIM